jgi:hypothetical protein
MSATFISIWTPASLAFHFIVKNSMTLDLGLRQKEKLLSRSDAMTLVVLLMARFIWATFNWPLHDRLLQTLIRIFINPAKEDLFL